MIHLGCDRPEAMILGIGSLGWVGWSLAEVYGHLWEDVSLETDCGSPLGMPDECGVIAATVYLATTLDWSEVVVPAERPGTVQASNEHDRAIADWQSEGGG